MFLKALTRNVRVLTIVTVVAIQLLILFNWLLAGRIESASQRHFLQTLQGLEQYFPAANYNNDLFKSCYVPRETMPQPADGAEIDTAKTSLANGETITTDQRKLLIAGNPWGTVSKLYLAKLDGEVTGYILEGATYQGYSGLISTLLVTDAAGTIKAVRVLTHSETPGLGDKIITTDWVHEFDDVVLADVFTSAFAVQKDGGNFTQFTGATITPRAVVESIKAQMMGAVDALVHDASNLEQYFVPCDSADSATSTKTDDVEDSEATDSAPAQE